MILLVIALAFLVAACNHAVDMFKNGLFPYAKLYNAPEALNYYWSSLTLLDPLAVILLIYNVRAGLILALCIMFTDVPVNLYANAMYWRLPSYKNYFLVMQILFLMFLLLTASRIWRLSRPARDKEK